MTLGYQDGRDRLVPRAVWGQLLVRPRIQGAAGVL